MNVLKIERLTREAFAPFGGVIDLRGAHRYFINEGTTERFHDLTRVDVGADARVLVNVFRGQPRQLPFEIRMMERHLLGSQTFLPLGPRPWLVVVAESGDLDPRTMKAFVNDGWQGVTYAKGVWHHPLLALEEASDFVVIDRGGPGNNCDEQSLAESFWLTAEAIPPP